MIIPDRVSRRRGHKSPIFRSRLPPVIAVVLHLWQLWRVAIDVVTQQEQHVTDKRASHQCFFSQSTALHPLHPHKTETTIPLHNSKQTFKRPILGWCTRQQQHRFKSGERGFRYDYEFVGSFHRRRQGRVNCQRSFGSSIDASRKMERRWTRNENQDFYIFSELLEGVGHDVLEEPTQRIIQQ